MEYKKINLPDNLSQTAEKYIKSVIDYLTEANKINAVDGGTLRLLADSFNQYLIATDRVNIEGLTVEGSRNTIVAHPCVRIAKDAKATCLSLMVELGLTIKSRVKLSNIEGDNEITPLAEFMKNL